MNLDISPHLAALSDPSSFLSNSNLMQFSQSQVESMELSRLHELSLNSSVLKKGSIESKLSMPKKKRSPIVREEEELKGLELIQESSDRSQSCTQDASKTSERSVKSPADLEKIEAKGAMAPLVDEIESAKSEESKNASLQNQSI